MSYNWGTYDPNYFDVGWIVWATCSVLAILKWVFGR